MDGWQVKIISQHHPDRMQVCFIGKEMYFNRRGKKIVKKVSITRHLHFDGADWTGRDLDQLTMGKSIHYRNYTEWLKAVLKPQPVVEAKAA